jgi:hypothetical protein
LGSGLFQAVVEYGSGSSAWLALRVLGGDVDEGTQAIRLTDEQRIEWLRLIRSQNVGRARFAP